MKGIRKRGSIFLVALMLISTILNGPIIALANTADDENSEQDRDKYTIYPTPHNITYLDENFEITDEVNIVHESTVDHYTVERVESILEAKNINYSISESIDATKTNFLIGVHGSDELVDKYFEENSLTNEPILEKLDANIVSIQDHVIAVLGKDIDSAFYGVTTVMHIFKQLEERTIESLLIEDYADIKGRGFIEGYYGEPWSTEDRADLMRFGGQFKMNSYLYAPKDDPKHNADWRELYTEEELADIQYLADEGNMSKTRFVYTLHPFMNKVFRFNTEENYQADLNVIKAKFTQLLDNGVRKFGILGDDAGVPGGNANNYVRLMVDLTDWLLEIEDDYPGLVTDMIFTPNDYMGFGDSQQIQTLKNLPDSVSIVQTGGRVWGEVTDHFTSTFTQNAGRGPYLWINWPVTDNSKNHLIMGGNEKFLHPGVSPDNIEGIVLNPMQQSEPSKTAIFANADYSWNIWDLEQAQQNWQDSFAYMDHLDINETEASNALRELSKHMINQNMDGRVVKLEESVELAPKLNAFKDALGKEPITEQAEDLINEFEIIREAAEIYKENPGNERLRDQIIYWLDSAIDTANAAIHLLRAEIAHEAGNKSEVWENYSQGQADFEASKNHPFSYIDHLEYAEVGVQHIVPFVKTLLNDVSIKVQSIVNPDLNPVQVITNRSDNPVGELSNVLDNNLGTDTVFRNPTVIEAGTYIGVLYEKPITMNTVRFELGAISNSNDTFQASKAQYTIDGKEWIDIEGAAYGHVNQVVLEDLGIEARGVRLIATERRTNTWLGIKDIVINEGEQSEEDNNYDDETFKLMVPGHFKVYAGTEANLFDGNDSTSIWYNPSGQIQDTSVAGDYIGLDLGRVHDIGNVSFKVGAGDGDKWTNYQLEYSADGEEYTVFKTYEGSASGIDHIAEDLTGIQARYIRLTNTRNVNKWIKFTEIDVEVISGTSKYTYTNNETYKNVNANHSLEEISVFQTENITLKPGEYFGVKLERIKELLSVEVDVTSDQLTLEASANTVEWTEPAQGVLARYVRLANHTDQDITFDLNKFVVSSNELYGPSFVETSIGYAANWTDDDSRKTNTLLNLMDKNFGTKTIFSDFQKKDDYITYSLGETRGIDSIRLYNDENNVNYIRDAKIEVSMDNENWEEIASIGDGEDNLAGGIAGYEDMIEDGYTHDSVSPGNYYFGNDDVGGIEAKYIRIMFTANYNQRYTHINEILINDGEYVQTENNPTFVTDPIEREGFGPNHLIDGDLSTAFRPDMTNRTEGSLIYRLSEKTDAAVITIVQGGGNAISNAEVQARIGKDEWVTLGILDESLNTFYNTKYDHIFEIKLVWGNVQPAIYEMSISTNKDLLPESPDKSELVNAIAQAKAISNDEGKYTEESFNALEKAIEAAERVTADDNATNAEINDALTALNTAIEALTEIEVTVDKSLLEVAIAEAQAISNEDDQYTKESFEILEDAIEAAQLILNDTDATQAEVNAATVNLQTAINQLEESAAGVDQEILETATADAKEISNKDGQYTEESFAILQSAILAAEAVLANEDATAEELEEAYAALKEAIRSLVEAVDKTVLAETVTQAKAVSNEDGQYTEESFTAFKTAIENAEIVLTDENATKEDVQSALLALEEAWDNLEQVNEKPTPEVDKSSLEDAIEYAKQYEKGKFTEESWKAFTDAFIIAQAILADDQATQQSIDAALKDLETAISNLKTASIDPVGPTDPTDPSDPAVPTIPKDPTNQDKGDDLKGEGTGQKDGSELPKTATNMMNLVLSGVSILLIGLSLLYMVYRRKRVQ